MRAWQWVAATFVVSLAIPTGYAQTQTRDPNATRPTIGTASLSGTVTTQDDAGRPLRRVMVALAASDLQSPFIALTDDRGGFLFAGVPAGTYSLSALKAAYVPAFYGARRPGRGPGVPIAILEGQKVTGVSLKLLRGGVITGAVRQPSGQPAAGVNIRLSEVAAAGQRRPLTLIEPMRTDDRGMYRFFGLAPGRYIVMAQPTASPQTETRRVTSEEVQWAEKAASRRALAPGSTQAPLPPAPDGGATVGSAPIYFPGTADAASAGVVTVGPGEERASVDFTLSLVSTARISGVVLDPDGRPMPRASVSLPAPTSNDPTDMAMTLLSGMIGGQGGGGTGTDGTFLLRGVVPGRYKLQASATPRPTPGAAAPSAEQAAMDAMAGMMSGRGGGAWFAESEITVDGRDLTGLTLRLQPGMNVSGKVVFEVADGIKPPELSRVRVALSPLAAGGNPMLAMMSAMMGSGGSPVAADGTFTLKGLLPDQYRATATLPGVTAGGWILKSAVLNGVDLADTPLDLRAGQDLSGLAMTMTNQPTEVSGTVLDAAGRPTGGFPIIVFSSNRAHWIAGSRRVQQARPSSDGKFKVSGLPAGEYFVAAVTEIEPGDLADPAFLEQLAAAAFKITLADGEKKQQDLKLGGG